ncbi:MAG: hypothetical protein ABIG44_13570 [Planctomycetota bacterium]
MNIEERIERLERANRRMKVVALGLLAVLLGAGLVAGPAVQQAASPRVIEASGFRLVDNSGKTRAMLVVSKEGPVGLSFLDENGKMRAIFGETKDGPALGFLDENEKVRLSLRLGRTTTLDGKRTTYPESSILLYGPDEKVIWEAP